MSKNNVYNWTEADLASYLAHFNRSPISAADVESNPSDGPAPTVEAKEAHPRFRIVVHSKRRRLCDPDGISAKAVIDGLCEGGLLPNDGPQVVKEVIFTQEKSKTEETVIEIWQIE